MHSSLLLLGGIGAGTGEGGHDPTRLLWTLLVLFVAAKLGAELFERLGQPAVIAEILAGVLVGPQVLKLAAPTDVTRALAELGVVFLLFLVGLHTRPSELMRVGRDAFLVACGGVILPFLFGFFYMGHLGYPTAPALFVGAALVATSVGITARVLSRLGVVRDLSSRVILGAAVIDDILGLLVLAVVGSLTRGSGVDYGQIALTFTYAGGFVGLMLLGGHHVIGRARPIIERMRIGHSLYIGAIAICLLLSVAAGTLGIAAIVGAFLAGMAFAEVAEETGLHRWFEGLSEFMTPFFLAGIGMQVDIGRLAGSRALSMCAVLTLLAVIGKVVGCGLPMWHRGRLTALQVGVGMVPRGEVGIIVAQYGLASRVFDGELFAVVICVAVATTLIAPPILARLYPHQAPVADPYGFGEETEAELEVA